MMDDQFSTPIHKKMHLPSCFDLCFSQFLIITESQVSFKRDMCAHSAMKQTQRGQGKWTPAAPVPCPVCAARRGLYFVISRAITNMIDDQSSPPQIDAYTVMRWSLFFASSHNHRCTVYSALKQTQRSKAEWTPTVPSPCPVSATRRGLYFAIGPTWSV